MAKTTAPPSEALLQRVRTICFGFPGTEERLSHGSPSFFAGGKMFVGFVDDHHGDGRVAIWCKSDLREQKRLVAEDPNRFYVPPYVGVKGWVGIRLDRATTNWTELAILIEAGWASVVTKRIAEGPVRPAPPPPERQTTDLALARAALAKLTAICDALPESTTEHESAHASFRVRKKTYAYFLDNHHGDGNIGVCVKVDKGANATLAKKDPKRFYLPAYIAGHGYVGIRIHGARDDWDDIAERVAESFRRSAPKQLAALQAIGAPPGKPATPRRKSSTQRSRAG